MGKKTALRLWGLDPSVCPRNFSCDCWGIFLTNILLWNWLQTRQEVAVRCTALWFGAIQKVWECLILLESLLVPSLAHFRERGLVFNSPKDAFFCGADWILSLDFGFNKEKVQKCLYFPRLSSQTVAIHWKNLMSSWENNPWKKMQTYWKKLMIGFVSLRHLFICYICRIALFFQGLSWLSWLNIKLHCRPHGPFKSCFE